MNTRINERYEVNLNEKDNILGKGGEGEVFIGKDVLLKIDVAVKVVDITNRIFSPIRTKDNIQKLEQEFKKVEVFDHSNIVGYYDWGVFSRKKRIYFATIMDLADSGSLAAWEFNKESNSLKNIHKFFIGILQGLKYIHEKGIIHRDLKPSNILIKKSDKGNFSPLLTDLLSNIGENANSKKVVTAKFEKTFGTIEYMAPELLGTKDIFVGTMTDLWSFGVILYEFFKGELPFGSREKGDSPINIAKNILSKKVAVSDIPKPYDKIVEICLEKDLTSRVSKSEILIELLKKQRDLETTNNENQSEGFKRLSNSRTRKLSRRKTIILQSKIPLQSMAVRTKTIAAESVSLPSPDEWLDGFSLEGSTNELQKNKKPKTSNKAEKSLLEQIQFLKEEIEALKKEKEKREEPKLSRNNLFDLIANDKIGDCFNKLNAKRETFAHETMKAFIVIKGEWSQLKTQELLGLIDFSTIVTSTNKVRHKLLTFIELLEFE
jgi:serine/threonine protein kinase